MKPFIVDDVGNIQLAEGLRALPIGSVLFSLKYNKQEGDSDGRKKYRINKEVDYLYHKNSWESAYQNMSNELKESEVRKVLDLDDKWKMSDELVELEEHVLKMQENNNAWRSLELARRLLMKLEEQLDDTEDIEVISKYLRDLPKLNETVNLLQKQFDASKKSILAVGQHEVSDWEK